MSSEILLDKIIMFDKKSVYIGNSISEFNKIRNILEEQKIKYTYDLIDRQGTFLGPGIGVARSINGLSSEENSFEKLYEIKMHKKDYEKIANLIFKIN